MNSLFSRKALLKNNIYIIAILLFIIPLLLIKDFGSAASLTVLLKNISLWGIMAIGMMFVLLLGYPDLSQGMNVSMLTVVLAILSKNIGLGWAIIITVSLGTLGGILNGLIITKINVNPFITTLGTMMIFKGIGLLISGGSPIANENEGLRRLFEIKILELPFITITLPMIVMLVCLIAAAWMIRYTKLGQNIFVTGGNPEAAKVAGISISAIFIICYMMVGVSCGITAVLLTSFQSSGNAAFGETYALQSIAACVLGGIRMSGGFGNPLRAILGVTALQLIIKILYKVASMFANMQIGIIGLILILVLILDMLSTRASMKTGK